MESEWTKLTPEEKREQRFQRWISPQNTKFNSEKAEQAYKTRVQRFIDVIQLKVPDRVPFSLSPGFFPATYFGITLEKAMYDADQLVLAFRKFVNDFDVDTLATPNAASCGQVLERLDYKMYKWAGHGIAPTVSFQFVEAEYMKADEYDALIRDPSDFWFRTYLPRVFGAMTFNKLAPLTDLFEIPAVMAYIAGYGKPEVQSALQALLEAGREASKWMKTVGKFNEEIVCSGIPRFTGGMVKAPFDTLGDTLRGTQGIIKDMYRQPEKILEAMERIVPIEIQRGVGSANASGVPIVYIPLHKGADGFMSAKQYEQFYWPTLKKVVMGLINEGAVPVLFAEGGYNSRLDIIQELPKGKVVWYFDRSDVARAKAALASSACIMGFVPVSLLCTGTRGEVKDFCKKLIEVAGKDGGYIMATGTGIDNAKPDNVQAIIETVKEYGVYR